MTRYAIGDIHGCYHTLRALLAELHFDPTRDEVWFVGDLVNRGLHSLDCLRFAIDHEPTFHMVLGNHDLHLLAAHAGLRELKKKDTLAPILEASDADALVDWLRARPFAWWDFEREPAGEAGPPGWLMVHAGISPLWSASRTIQLADAASQRLGSEDYPEFLRDLYEVDTEAWVPGLAPEHEARSVVRFLVSARTCDESGRLDPDMKGPPSDSAPGFRPWYEWRSRSDDPSIVFGHWAALGYCATDKYFGLDTGCAWGGRLTALRLEDRRVHSVPVDPRDIN